MQIGVSPHKGSITNVNSPTASQLFGAYYADISKQTSGARRTALDQARMQLLQQLVTAKLNCAAFTCSASITSTISSADTAYAGSNTATILSLAGQLDAYNNAGDAQPIPTSLGNPGAATPKTSQSIANKVFWDAP